MTMLVADRGGLTTFLAKRISASLALLMMAGTVFAAAFDTSPAAKIVKMDVYGTYGTAVFVQLDTSVTVTIPGFSSCTAPNNYFYLGNSSDADRSVLAQLQLAYALKKTVVLHIAGCNAVPPPPDPAPINYPAAIGVRTN